MGAPLVTCPTCNGEKIVDHVDCPECKGRGRVVCHAAADALVHDVLGPEVGHKGSEAVLKALRDNRNELVAWLIEAGILARTKYGLTTRTGHDGWGHSTGPETVVSVIPEGGDSTYRLYWVVIR